MEFTPVLIPESTKYGNNRWTVFSPKLKRTISIFSDLEYYNWLRIEMDPTIVDFCEQPIKIEEIIDGHKRSSIPDMITKNIDGKYTLIEVKHKKELKNERVLRQIQIQKKWVSKNNYVHKIFTDEILKEKWKLLAWKKIIQTISSTDESTLMGHEKLILSRYQNSIITIDTILKDSDNSNDALKAIYYLLYKGRIEFSCLSEKMTRHTEVII